MSNKIVLRVKDVDNCPLYHVGERMVLAPPEVLKLNSDRICALALAKLFPFSLEYLQRVNEPGYQPVESSCPGCQGGKAYFQLEPFTTPRHAGITMRLERAAVDHEAPADEPHAEPARKASDDAPFLSQLSAEVVRELVSCCKVQKYHEPTVLLREGDEGRHFYIVGKGAVDILKIDESNKEETFLTTLKKGDCFGEMSLLTGEPISATVRTRGEGTAILSCRKDVFNELKLRLPQLADHFNRVLIRRLRKSNDEFQSELGRGMRGRLAMMPLPDVIQTLSSARRTGTLTLTTGGYEGVILFLEGNIVGAGVGDVRGDEAIYSLLAWTEGDFKFRDEDSIEPDGTITQNVTGLLMEGMRRLDEVQSQRA